MHTRRERAPAAAIRRARREAGLTQSKLGEAIGVSQQEIAKYEAGTRDPTAHMRAIASVLRRPLDYFYPATPIRGITSPRWRTATYIDAFAMHQWHKQRRRHV
jgi:transcriptional regulator with XRE-family HTH domain